LRETTRSFVRTTTTASSTRLKVCESVAGFVPPKAAAQVSRESIQMRWRCAAAAARIVRANGSAAARGEVRQAAIRDHQRY
jgi:hypothetical protein